MLNSKAIPYEQPYVVDCNIVDSSVVIDFESKIRLTLVPHRDDYGNIIGLEEYILTYENKEYAHYRSTDPLSDLTITVSKLFLAELMQVALNDYLYWEYLKHSTTPEIVYMYVVAEAAREIAEKLHREALV